LAAGQKTRWSALKVAISSSQNKSTTYSTQKVKDGRTRHEVKSGRSERQKPKLNVPKKKEKKASITYGLRVLGGFNWAGLSEVTVPDSVQKIPKEAFAGCMSLRRALFGPASELVIVKSGAIQFSSVVTVGVIPAGLRAIQANVFAECHGLRSIQLGDTFGLDVLHPQCLGPMSPRSFVEMGGPTLKSNRNKISVRQNLALTFQGCQVHHFQSAT
jgi:hypothetical protein